MLRYSNLIAISYRVLGTWTANRAEPERHTSEMALENGGLVLGDCCAFSAIWRAESVSRRTASLRNHGTIPRAKTTLQFPED